MIQTQNDHPANSWKLISAIILGVLVFFIYLPALYSVGMLYDFPPHITWAEELALTGQTSLPHYLFQQVTVIVRTLIPFQVLARFIPQFGVISITWLVAGFATALLFSIALAEMIFFRLLNLMSGWRPSIAYPTSLVLALSLLIVGPVTIFTWWQGRLYFGYIGINLFHNPTILLLKPLALSLFWMIARHFFNYKGLGSILILAIISALTLHAKPNYTIALLPALGLFFAYALLKGKKVNWKAVIFGVFIPSIIVLSYQYLITFGGEKASVIFAPLLVMSGFLTRHDFLPLWMLLPLYLLSILFPLVVAIFYYRPKEEGNFSLELAWLTFIVGTALTYLFAETGIRQGYGNFLWSSQIALFILFVESVFFVLRRLVNQSQIQPSRLQLGLVSAAFLLHLISGAFFYIQEIVHPAAMW